MKGICKYFTMPHPRGKLYGGMLTDHTCTDWAETVDTPKTLVYVNSEETAKVIREKFPDVKVETNPWVNPGMAIIVHPQEPAEGTVTYKSGQADMGGLTPDEFLALRRINAANERLNRNELDGRRIHRALFGVTPIATPDGPCPSCGLDDAEGDFMHADDCTVTSPIPDEGAREPRPTLEAAQLLAARLAAVLDEGE